MFDKIPAEIVEIEIGAVRQLHSSVHAHIRASASPPILLPRIACSVKSHGRKIDACGLWFIVYGLWFMVYGLWFMVYGLWFMIYGLWFMVYGLWFMVYG